MARSKNAALIVVVIWELGGKGRDGNQRSQGSQASADMSWDSNAQTVFGAQAEGRVIGSSGKTCLSGFEV